MQANAAIYDSSSISLDKEKTQKKKTLGKGWFDLEVYFAIFLNIPKDSH
jgi:hypothetical protein